MLDDEIAKLKKMLNEKTKINDLNDAEILKISQELDNLILEFYKELQRRSFNK